MFFSMARLDRFYCFKHYFSIFEGCSIVPVGCNPVMCLLQMLNTSLPIGNLTLFVLRCPF